MLKTEMREVRVEHAAELQRVKAEHLHQIIETFRTEGMQGLEGLAKMTGLGQFAQHADKERRRACEQEGASPRREFEGMRREYEQRLVDMKTEYEAKLRAYKARAAAPASPAAKPPAAGAPRRGSPQRSAESLCHTFAASSVAPRVGGVPPGHRGRTEALARGYYAKMGY
eukprot:TRINITY_DN6138_c0_g1_i10.p2 TRINITY_DN6138_c0_g1~~TRINITY_DN6138_c0_g1_i10.p2  ORF type:complete len:170 (+),score=41.82 TRINITY_DN6138_c0_g1_i10:334-843(+)